MKSTIVLLLVALFGLLMLTQSVNAAEYRNPISASASISITVQILPRNRFNQRLSSTHAQLGVETKSCLNAIRENDFDPVALNSSDQILAGNFFCNTRISEYKLVESDDVITLMAIPV